MPDEPETGQDEDDVDLSEVGLTDDELAETLDIIAERRSKREAKENAGNKKPAKRKKKS